MKFRSLHPLAALIAGAAMMTAIPAYADRDDWRDHDRDGWRSHDRGWGNDHRQYKKRWKHADRERVVIRERIIERRPVVREYRYYEQPSRYYGRAPVYSRDPAVVIGVSIPPIVIPIR